MTSDDPDDRGYLGIGEEYLEDMKKDVTDNVHQDFKKWQDGMLIVSLAAQ